MDSEPQATLSESDLLTLLRDCYDPRIPCNIVDLGLVDAVEVRPDPEAPGANIAGMTPKHRVVVTLTPSTPNDDTEAQLSAQIQNRLAGLEAVSRTEVILRREPAWTPLRLTPAGRRTLGLDGNPGLVQIR